MTPFSRTNSSILPKRANLLCVITIILLLILMTSGCAIFTINTMQNHPFDQNDPQKTRASVAVADKDLYNGKFIGIALSGGGSRAANFSAAVMLELDAKLKVLGKTTAISSVSGSSLTAAYYGLYAEDRRRWQQDEIRTQLKKDFEARWLGRWFLPQNALLYWITNFSRSDIMKEVLDSNLFEGHTFADMGNAQPRILINATSISRGEQFVFSEEMFAEKLKSKIGNYPVANAVMASSAFPGAFHDMTLYNFSRGQNAHEKDYAHLIDGGSFDNLGVTTLLDMVDQLQNESKSSARCFLFVVDAYPYRIEPKHLHDADSRSFIDYFVDSNIADSSEALLTVRRNDLLYQLNADGWEDDQRVSPFHIKQDERESIELDYGTVVKCGVWHISLERLLSTDFQNYAMQAGVSAEKIKELAVIVNSIPTRYKLTGKDKDGKDITPDKLQEYLFNAAEYLINYDKDKEGMPMLEQVRAWLNQ
jgi:NTE family protein